MRRRQNKFARVFLVILVILLCIGLLLPYVVSIFGY